MAYVKVTDLAFARLQSPDLDLAEQFLTDFGMVRAARTPSALYMRGTGATHHVQAVHQGEPRFLGLAFWCESEEDLRRFAAAPGAEGVEHLDEPGGGLRVRVTDPNGYQMEVLFGLEELEPLPVRKVTRAPGEVLRIPRGPSQVKRLGHAVLMTPNAKEKIQWYRSMFGFLPSDEIYAGAQDNIIASFNRCDRGDAHVDHHSFLCVEGPSAGLNHLAYEVQNLDDLMLGHDHLKQAGRYRHWMGIGRHVIGSQVFDYWQDPWGRAHEHWWDTDQLNRRHPANYIPVEEGLLSQWGPHIPETFVTHASP